MLFAAKKALTLTEFLQTSRGSWAAMAVLIVVMFGLVAWFTKWWREETVRQKSPEDLLVDFRDLHNQGQLTPEEYRAVRERLVQKSGRSDGKDNSTNDSSTGDSAGTPIVPQN